MLPHCTAHMPNTISLHFSRSLWAGPVFQRLVTSGMPPLTSQPFGGMTRVLKSCEWNYNLTWPFLTTVTRVLWGIGNQKHRLYWQCSFVNMWHLQWQWLRGIRSCEARFPCKNIRNQGAAGRITCEFTVAWPNTHFTWENTRKVNLRNAAGFLRGACSLEEGKEFGSGRPHHK